MADLIASTNIAILRPSGESVDATIRIFAPIVETKNASCGVQFDGLYDRVQNICGEDTFQALALAMKFVRNILDGEESKGAVINLADDDEPFPWRQCWF